MAPPSVPPRSPIAAVRTTLAPVVGPFWAERRPLLVPTLAYVGGLVVWSVNASRNDLGPVVAFDLQYLVGGVIPALLVLAAVAVTIFVAAAPRWTRARLAQATRLKRVLAYSLGALAVAAVFGLAVGGAADLELLRAVAGPALAFSFVAALFTFEESRFYDIVWVAYAGLGGLFMLTLAFLFYSETVYPRLPQSLGGGAPRCAYLDVRPSALSGTTLAALGARTGGETVRTAKLDVLFARDDVLFVRRDDGPTHELRGDAVRAVVSC